MYTILVADDDPELLSVVSEILREPGYRVLTACDGYEAIRILADRHIDLMISDISMPGLDGVELGFQAKVMRPHLHIIYMTGFSEASKKARYGRVLQKPIRAADLITTVQQEMSAA